MLRGQAYIQKRSVYDGIRRSKAFSRENHIEIVVNLLRDIPFDEIRVVPNGTPPHRQSIGSIDDRLKMVSLAFERIKKITVDDREIRREGFSYAIDSAKEILREFKNDQIIWIMGSDAFLEIKQ